MGTGTQKQKSLREPTTNIKKDPIWYQSHQLALPPGICRRTPTTTPHHTTTTPPYMLKMSSISDEESHSYGNLSGTPTRSPTHSVLSNIRAQRSYMQQQMDYLAAQMTANQQGAYHPLLPRRWIWISYGNRHDPHHLNDQIQRFKVDGLEIPDVAITPFVGENVTPQKTRFSFFWFLWERTPYDKRSPGNRRPTPIRKQHRSPPQRRIDPYAGHPLEYRLFISTFKAYVKTCFSDYHRDQSALGKNSKVFSFLSSESTLLTQFTLCPWKISSKIRGKASGTT